MRRGDVDKTAGRKKSGKGFGDDAGATGQSAAGATLGLGLGANGGGMPDGLAPLKSPISAGGDAFKRAASGKQGRD